MKFLGSPEFKVGALVVLVIGLIGVMALRVAEAPNLFGGRKHNFLVDSAGGLVKNSAVKMAGIKVGVISDIVLENGRARVFVTLDPNVKLTESSRVELRADGILGDKHVEIIPGDQNAPTIAPDSELKSIAGKGGLDDIMEEAGRVAKNMNTLLDTLNKATTDGDESTEFGRIVKYLEGLSKDLNDLTSQNKGKISEIVDRLHNISKNVDTYINEESLARMDKALKNIQEITDKVNRGDGTLGRLINDDATVEELNSAISNVNKFLGGAEKLETSIDFHSEYLSTPGQTKSYLGLKIQPGLDRYYQIAVVDDPLGVKRTVRSETTSGGVTNSEENTTTYMNKIKLTAVFAKNFWDFTVKGGLIENYGGVGVDYHLIKDRLTLSTELFNFADLQMRAFVRYDFFKGVYVIGGGDNILSNDNRQGSAFIGAGLFITNDDLKLLAAKAGSF